MIYDHKNAPGAITEEPVPNAMTPPTLNTPNIYGYDYWRHMRMSCYYRLPESRDPFVFDYKGTKARLHVGFYPQDPRYMRLSLVGEDGYELYEITSYFRNAYGELEWKDEIIGVVPKYAAMCRDGEFEADGISVFHQLLHKHLCVPVYSPEGKILVRSNPEPSPVEERRKDGATRALEALPEYVFDEEALRLYDEPGMIAYDREQELYDAARYYWPGGEQSWTLGVIYRYDEIEHKLNGWPRPDDYIGDISLESAGRITDCVREPDDGDGKRSGDDDGIFDVVDGQDDDIVDAEVFSTGEIPMPELVMGPIESPFANVPADTPEPESEPEPAPAPEVFDCEQDDDGHAECDSAVTESEFEEPHHRASITEAFTRSFTGK